jgi:hypothetical protein
MNTPLLRRAAIVLWLALVTTSALTRIGWSESLSSSVLDTHTASQAVQTYLSRSHLEHRSELTGKIITLKHGAYTRQQPASSRQRSVTHRAKLLGSANADLDADGITEAITVIEERLCRGRKCRSIYLLNIWSYRAGKVKHLTTKKLNLRPELGIDKLIINGGIITLRSLVDEQQLRTEYVERYILKNDRINLVERVVSEPYDESPEGGC